MGRRMAVLPALVAIGCGSMVTEPNAIRTMNLLADRGGRDFVGLGPVTVFVSSDSTTGSELWRTDGTAQGTRLVKDIYPGPGDSGPYKIARHGDAVFFAASTAAHGNELWRSDGTEAGTYLVRDIYPGPSVSGRGNSFPNEVVSAGSFVAFTACDEAHGRELWRSDGTASGTVLVADIDPGRGEDTLRLSCGDNPGPRDLTVVGGIVYFFAKHPDFGTELWRSDGTFEGTWMVTEVYPGPDPPPIMRSSGIPVANLVAAGARLFFFGPGGLWTSDGTAEGTRSIGPFGALLTGAATRAYFAGLPGLWVTDGTPQGTRMLHSVDLGTNIRFDGRISRMTAIGDLLFFEGIDTSSGYEPWRSDGTPGGTIQLADVDPGSGSSDPDGFIAVGGSVYFVARGADEQWRLFAAGPTGPATQVTDMTWRHDVDGPSLGAVGDTLLLSGNAAGLVRLWAYRPGH